jgi:glyoxylase-like metal-dependent hydrolase (beta-lactamase superfamily II)
VWRQPDSPETGKRATMALVSCPVGAIGADDRKALAETLPGAFKALPERVDENVYACGFASASSYGASSYLIARPEGNVLVDSPRFASRLVAQLERMGGVTTMFLSHQDDVADHERFHRRFQCERVFHRDESHPAGAAMERLIEGGEPQEIAPDLVAIPTPGHTRGHMVLLYRDRFLFTGDHLWWSPERRQLWASKRFCWYSWRKQIESMERLLDYRFEWVLPGHGRRHYAPETAMHELMVDCVERMKRQ